MLKGLLYYLVLGRGSGRSRVGSGHGNGADNDGSLLDVEDGGLGDLVRTEPGPVDKDQVRYDADDSRHGHGTGKIAVSDVKDGEEEGQQVEGSGSQHGRASLVQVPVEQVAGILQGLEGKSSRSQTGSTDDGKMQVSTADGADDVDNGTERRKI